MPLTKQEKAKVRRQICNLLDEKCGNCNKRKELGNNHTKKWWNVVRNELQAYCIHECPVGQELQRLGHSLENELHMYREKPGPKTEERSLAVKKKLQEVSS